jgi:F-type H+-transporting ATPase subunit b
MLQIDLTLPIMMILFIVFAWLMKLVFFGPVTRVLAERQAYLEGAQAQANTSLAKLAELQEAYDNRLKAAHAAAQSAIHSAILEAETKRQGLIKQVSNDVADQVAEARSSIQEERSRAIAALGSEVGQFSDLITRKVLGAELAGSAAGGSHS